MSDPKSENTILQGEEQTKAFHRLQMIHALALDINAPGGQSPFRQGASIMEHARRCGYLGKNHGNIRSKQAALRAMVREFKEQVDPNYKPSDRVRKAIGDA